MTDTDLKTDPSEDKTLVFALPRCAVPPRFETNHPVLRTSYPAALGEYGLVVVLTLQQLTLLFADDEQLLILGLEQADAHG